MKIPAAIRKRLGELPASLREAYNEIYELRLKSYVEEQRSITKSAFKLLLSLQTPLDHEDFIHALSFCSEDRITLLAEDLLDLCFGFLVLDIGQNVYRFAHLSVREYLETKSEYSSESSHALAAQLCLRYLCTSNDSGPFLVPRDTWLDSSAVPKDMRFPSIDLKHDSRVMSCTINPSVNDQGDYNHDYPFLDRVQEYACVYWADHTAGSRYLRLLHPLSTMLRGFIMDASQSVSPWFMYWNRLVIHMFRFPGHVYCMPGWIFGRNKIKDMTHTPADYLFTAILWGFYDLLELRLRSSPDPLLLRSGTRGNEFNALQLACLYGNPDAVKFLRDWGWGLQVEDDLSFLALAVQGSKIHKRPSLPGLDIDDKNIETIRLLLSYGVDPHEKLLFSFRHFLGCSYPIWISPLRIPPIWKAIELESTEIVKLLLEYGVSADVENEMGLKTFHTAVIDGKHEIADLLLAESKDVDDFARSVCKELGLIHQALRRDDETILITALGNWPRDARGSWYLDHALWLAAIRSTKEDCVKALLAKGANANARFIGLSVIDAIHRRVSMENDFAILRLLLDHGADPQAMTVEETVRIQGWVER